jgi:predicted enzyme related to lactoylglutathione lyase
MRVDYSKDETGGKQNEKMNPVVHFEMLYEDRERLSKFYSNAFGWGIQK